MWPQGTRARYLRDRKVAAPLKRTLPIGLRSRCATSPRPKGRGPIEAVACTPVSAMRTSPSPRPKGRGPIEARRRGEGPLRGLRNLRDRKVAAPLKHVRVVGPERVVGDLRDRKVAAPLKLLVGAPDEATGGVSPRPKGRGPIEATGWTPTRRWWRYLRDRKVAAPLKHAHGFQLLSST